MKKLCSMISLFCVVCMSMCTSCQLSISTNTQNENNNQIATGYVMGESVGDNNMGKYYRIDDFDTIVIGVSTYQDICNIAFPKLVQMTSYGVLCEYPSANKSVVQIKCYGKELIVGSIEEV